MDFHARPSCPTTSREVLGEFAGATNEGMVALSVGVGLRVLHELVAAEVDEVMGPKGSTTPSATPTATATRDANLSPDDPQAWLDARSELRFVRAVAPSL